MNDAAHNLPTVDEAPPEPGAATGLVRRASLAVVELQAPFVFVASMLLTSTVVLTIWATVSWL